MRFKTVEASSSLPQSSPKHHPDLEPSGPGKPAPDPPLGGSSLPLPSPPPPYVTFQRARLEPSSFLQRNSRKVEVASARFQAAGCQPAWAEGQKVARALSLGEEAYSAPSQDNILPARSRHQG